MTTHLYPSRAKQLFFSCLCCCPFLGIDLVGFGAGSFGSISPEEDGEDGVSEGVGVFPPFTFTAVKRLDRMLEIFLLSTSVCKERTNSRGKTNLSLKS